MIIRTLYAKLSLILVILLITLGIVYGLFSLYASQLFLQEVNQRFNRDLARQLLVQHNMTEGEGLSDKEIKALFSYYMHINPAIEVYLLDVQGNILAFEAPQQKIKRHKVELEPIQQYLAGDMAYPILGDDPRHQTRKKIFSAAAFPFTGPPKQYLYVVLSGEDYDTVKDLLKDSYFLQVSLVAVSATVVLGLLVGLFLFNLLTRRIFRLSQLMESFRNSGFKDYIPFHLQQKKKPTDEIDVLGDSYDAMAERIIEQMQALEKKDSLRRNLVANVSHDLRTPLASLQGYLETLLLKTAEFSVDERKHYLGIAHKQSQRLTQLVAELFELSKLDAQEIAPDCEPISIAELAMDIAQKYRLPATEQGIDLQAEIPEQLPFIFADLKMINRVLENLISNAIRHTPEGGRLGIILSEQHGQVHVKICNSGPGIAEDDLPHLFERFYQAPENRRSRGAGLGLSIVKRVLELHGSEISVHSVPNQETCFAFSLTAWGEA